ncbi:MAG: response regulator [Anaerolineales bacterium]|jgi:signal transduction histidine kinase
MSEPLILVVEDDLALLEGVGELLKLSNYQVITATNGLEALALLDEYKPDLIVSDIMMPEMDGYAFHAAVRERPDMFTVPFIFLTARGEKRDIRKGKASGVDDYITKPFDDEDLLVAVESKLKRWAGIQKRRDEEIEDVKHRILLTLSHEFRTPLTYIINYADMLKTTSPADSQEEIQEFMDGIRRGAKRLNKLVEDFLVLVELETGEARDAYLYRRQEFDDTSAWLRVISRRFQADAEARGLELILDIPDELPTLVGDEVYLTDAIGRLIENAIKFSREESEWVKVSASQSNGYLRIDIHDQGIGVAPENVDSLFDLFHQLNREEMEQQGTGAGLAICKGIVEIHEGKVALESVQGEGSVFTIMIPFQPD